MSTCLNMSSLYHGDTILAKVSTPCLKYSLPDAAAELSAQRPVQYWL